MKLKAVFTTIAAVVIAEMATAMVWTETPDSPGEPVEFCFQGVCEMTRYVTEGASGYWSFFELANGYHDSHHYSQVTGIVRTSASIGDKELNQQEMATVALRDPQVEEGVKVSADGRFATLTGAITELRVAEFQAVLSQHPHLLGVSLNSRYGDATSALAIGNAIWDRRLSTFIPEDATCAGACAVVFLSGYDRQAEGSLTISPLIDPQMSSTDAFNAMWDLLVFKADTDQSILALYQTLHWTQSRMLDPEFARTSPVSRDLPGDALNH